MSKLLQWIFIMKNVLQAVVYYVYCWIGDIYFLGQVLTRERCFLTQMSYSMVVLGTAIWFRFLSRSGQEPPAAEAGVRPGSLKNWCWNSDVQPFNIGKIWKLQKHDMTPGIWDIILLIWHDRSEQLFCLLLFVSLQSTKYNSKCRYCYLNIFK